MLLFSLYRNGVRMGYGEAADIDHAIEQFRVHPLIGYQDGDRITNHVYAVPGYGFPMIAVYEHNSGHIDLMPACRNQSGEWTTYSAFKLCSIDAKTLAAIT